MSTLRQEQVNYTRIENAIDYIKANFKDQPSLDEIAQQVHLSPHHFQCLFTDWAGVSPKKFLQYMSIQYAKGLLKEGGVTLFDTAQQTGLSGTGRLHDLFINIEGMTPGEYKKGGEELLIRYSFADSPFGSLLIASTTKGICHIAFEDNEKLGLSNLYARFPYAQFQPAVDDYHRDVLRLFQNNYKQLTQIKLHLHGTAFQLKVWEALLKIPLGKLTTYGAIAQEIQSPKAFRAVGTAIGKNPIAFLIPCHRVIQSSGNIGGYRWGGARKSAMIGWEASKVNR